MDLDSVLLQLSDAQLVRRADDPERSFLFKHTLTQETSYQSLLLKRRREIHLRVAQAIEELYPDRLDEFAALLSQHYAETEDEAKTLEYSVLAGEAAARVYANDEAVEHYTRALKIAKAKVRAPERGVGGDSAQLTRLYVRRGRVLEVSGKSAEALRNYEEMEALALELGDSALELAALVALGTLHSVPSLAFDPVRGQARSQRALALARERGDRVAEARILWNLMLLAGHTHRPHEAAEFGEQSLALARELGLREQIAYTLNDFANLVYFELGQLQQGSAALDEAIQLWAELDNLPMLTDSYSNAAYSAYMMGDLGRAMELAQEAYRISLSIGNLWGQSYSLGIMGPLHLERGELDQALATTQDSIRLGQSGFTGALVIGNIFLAVAYAGMGEVNRGLESAKLAASRSLEVASVFRFVSLATLAYLESLHGDLTAAEETLREAEPEIIARFAYFGLPLILAQGEIGMARQDYARVIKQMDKIDQEFRSSGLRAFIADLLYYKAKALRALGNLQEAHAQLMEARTEAERLGSRRALWPILTSLSEIESERGNVDEAQRLRRQAREIIEFITEHIPSPELRESFLNQPSVRQVFNQAPS